MTAVLPLDVILDAVAAHEPEVLPEPPVWQAATALVLSEDGDAGPALLFIERTARQGDRWSGQMAFPGGKRDPADPDLATTARREAREEVGLELDEPVGRLDDVHGRGPLPGVVAPFVFHLAERSELELQPSEVASAVWIPVSHLLAPDSAVRYRYRGLGPFPGIRFDRYTVWGLTHGILTDFFDVIGEELPRPRFTFG